MTLWAFRFVLWYICILFTQPQNRFPFLYPFHIADICIGAATILHVFGALSEGKPVIRMGRGTITALTLLLFGFLAQYAGPLVSGTGWNGHIDTLVKGCYVLILLEAMTISVERVWAVSATIMVATSWWIKGGIRLSSAGATHSMDRLMGPAVSLVENPNGYAYLTTVMIPLYLYFYQQVRQKYLKWVFLFMAFTSVYIVFQTGSRTGMLALIVVGAFLVPKYFSKHKVSMIIAVPVVMILFSYTGHLNVERFKSIPTSIRNFLQGTERPMDELDMDEQSAQERRLKNRDTWALIKKYPVFGVGMNPDESKIPEDLEYALGQVHNELLMAGKQMGFIGMGLYLTLLGTLIFKGWAVQRYSAGWWPAASDLGWTFRLQGIAFLVGGFFSPVPWSAPLFIIVACASSLAMNITESAPHQAPALQPSDLSMPEARSAQA